jgi:hypothetical protein
MNDRLTVVFDDPELYRRLKVFAAERRLPLKHVIQAAVEDYLNALAPPRTTQERAWDWDEFWKGQEEIDRLGDEMEAAGEVLPTDLSDVKHHLYGRPKRGMRPVAAVAEEPATYDR